MKIDQLKEELQNYLIDLEDLERSKTTIRNYEKDINLFIKFLEAKECKEITQDNINITLKSYRRELKIRELKPSTRVLYLTEIIQFLETLDFKINIELPKNTNKNKKIKYLTMKEIKKVMDNIPKDLVRDRAVFQTLYRTGLRVSELSNLTKQDINLDSTDKTIAINVRAGKGGKDRTVYIDQDTLKLLNKMIYKRTRKGKEDNTDYLFINRNKNQLTERDMQNIIKKYAIATDKQLAKEGIKSNYKEKLTPHTLRHSYTIYLLNVAKRPINEVQELLGHENLATTSIYAKVDNETIKNGYGSIEWE